MRRSGIVVSIFAAALCALADGVPPRSAAADYPAFQRSQDFLLGATFLSADQARRVLPPEVAKKYIVMEVAIYPRDGAEVEVFAFDFSLRFGKDGDLHPATPEETVGRRDTHAGQPRIPGGPEVHGETGVIVATGRDPVTGRRGTGVGTYESVGIGVGGPRQSYPPPSSGGSQRADRDEALVRSKELPEGKTTRAVAGYLYFPKKGSTGGAGELRYVRNATQIVLRVPAAK